MIIYNVSIAIFSSLLDNYNHGIRVKICTAKKYATCIGKGCHRSLIRNKLISVPSLLRYLVRIRHNLILDWGLQVCKDCLPKITNEQIEICNVVQFDSKLHQHQITNTYRNWYERQLLLEIKHWRSKFDKKNKQYEELYKLHHSNRGFVQSTFNKHRNRNHYNLRNQYNLDAEEAKLYQIYEDEIDPSVISNKAWNRIQYKNLSDRDCHIWTGFNKKQLIQQAKEVSLPPEDIFLFRVRVYRYYTWREQEMMFGYSASSIKRNFVRTLDIMFDKYAKPRLLNKSFAEPGLSRDIINNKHTPRFVKKVRGLDEEMVADDHKSSIVINQDSTYQYSEYIHSNHTLFKGMRSAHKKIPLLKVHIWSCTDGRPIWAVVCYSDFDHADGDIFATCFNKQHLDACIADLETHPNSTKEEILARHEKKMLCFHDLETCSQMRLLQDLLCDPTDNLISDNGYKTKDGRLKMPAEPPQGDDKRITTAAACWRRSITLVRQTCERMHRWCKRNTFCRQRIRSHDIKYVNKVWNVVMADIKFLDVKLMKDSYETNKFVELLLALRYVMQAPVEKYYIPSYCKQKLNATKRKKLEDERRKKAQTRNADTEHWNSQISQFHSQGLDPSIRNLNDANPIRYLEPQLQIYSSEEAEDHQFVVPVLENRNGIRVSNVEDSKCEHKESEDFHSLKNIKNYDQNFELVAVGFKQISEYLEYILKKNVLDCVFYNEPLVSQDIQSFIGKKYANKLAKEYIAKMDRKYSDFKLYKCKSNKFVFLFRNLTSKYKVSNTYDIVISFAQIAYYNKAQKLIELEDILNDPYSTTQLTEFQKYAQRNNIELQTTLPRNSSSSLAQFYFNQIIQKQELVLSEDENHWYKWLKNGGKYKYRDRRNSNLLCNTKGARNYKTHLVSPYLSAHNRNILQQLTQRRIELLKCNKEYRWHNYIIGNMRKPRLFQFALDHKIKFDDIKKLKVAGLKKYIYEYLHRHDPHNKLHYTRYVNNINDVNYDAIVANFESLARDTQDDHNLFYDSENENTEQLHLIAQGRIQYDLNNKKLNISELCKEKTKFYEFINIHKIFGEKEFVYTKMTKKKIFKAVETPAMQQWFTLTNYKTKFKGGQDKFKFLVALVKDWQIQFFPENDQQQYRTSQRENDIVSNDDNDEKDEELKEDNVEERNRANLVELSSFVSSDLPVDSVLRLDRDLSDLIIPDIEAESHEWLDKLEIEQYWYDIDFDLWQSPLARLGITCSCRSGAQLPSCCAHGSTILWLIWFSCYNSIDNAYKLSRRDERILDSASSHVYNFAWFKKWIKADNEQFGGIARFCHCKNEFPKNELEVFCEGCQYYYHPSCCGTTSAIVDQGLRQFRCKSCTIWKLYTFKYAAPVQIFIEDD